jgi:hypothetical protein
MKFQIFIIASAGYSIGKTTTIEYYTPLQLHITSGLDDD